MQDIKEQNNYNTKRIEIEKIYYQVCNNEFLNIYIQEYCNLNMFTDVGELERIIGLISDLSDDLSSTNVITFNATHGGFIPLQLSKRIKNNYISFADATKHKNHISNFLINREKFGSDKVNEIRVTEIEKLLDNNTNTNTNTNELFILFFQEDFYNKNDNKNNLYDTFKEHIIIFKDDLLLGEKSYKLSDTDYYVYIPDKYKEIFCNNFKYYFEGNNPDGKLFNYSNVINLCIMVKNGGDQFEEMLLKNLHIIDRWTILDTGSTDKTIEIINKMLIGNKKGKLYQEPFIDFKNSRNRLLDLAGETCKYTLMLDDTYIIKGELKKFLKSVEGDQFSDSFTMYIKSDDTEYGSNRLLKSNRKLRYLYKIHEVVQSQNNKNVVIPIADAHIMDERFDYMEERTMGRKELDLRLLQEELDEDPKNPRTYYYFAQTYNLLNRQEEAFYWFNKRVEHEVEGFIQEKVDAAFEAARIANFKLNKSWEECEKLYLRAYELDRSRPESLYFIAMHYYLENNKNITYAYLKKAFEIGYPIHCQYSLKPTLCFHFLPKFLTQMCYEFDNFELGEKSAELFLRNNIPGSDYYDIISSWYDIFKKLNVYKGVKIPNVPDKPIFCFVADGGFNPWSGSNILTSGVGGSETFIIEIARYIKKQNNFDVYVFCNTPNELDENFEGVIYKHLNKYYEFINTNYVKHCVISRFSEYIPVTVKGFSENVYFIIHDLTPSGIVIPIDNKVKNIFCLTEWHVEYFTNMFPQLKSITVPFYYGIDDKFKNNNETNIKIPNKFIYSSFPNRGLLQLLQMWPKIYEKIPTATLHIYSDVNNKWSNDVEPEKMTLIKKLLIDYHSIENKLGIYYYGWVNKKQLAEAWITSDIWFYPCTFMETFCLTALEAASSKTFVVTNDLAALQNTVGNRGVVISGDPTTETWKEQALQKIFYYMDETNKNEKQKLIEMNYNWSNTLSWENQAKNLIDNYIYPNDLIEYKGMYNWTNNLPSGEKNIFLNMISYFNNNYNKVKFSKPINILEVGVYTGVSLIEIVKLIPNSFGTGIDLWMNYNENELLSNIDNHKVKESFYKNIKNTGLENRIKGLQIHSTFGLLQFIKDNVFFDFIYVDGSHLLLDCYSDLVLSWQILERGGILAIDDYLYKKDDPNILNSPYQAVNHFLKVFENKYKLLSITYRVFLEKI